MITENQILDLKLMDSIPEGAIVCRTYHGQNQDVVQLWKYCPNGVPVKYTNLYEVNTSTNLQAIDDPKRIPIKVYLLELKSWCLKPYYTVSIFESETEAKKVCPEYFI